MRLMAKYIFRRFDTLKGEIKCKLPITSIIIQILHLENSIFPVRQSLF